MVKKFICILLMIAMLMNMGIGSIFADDELYSITVAETENGTITVLDDAAEAAEGEAISFSVTADTGYEMKGGSVMVTTESGEEVEWNVAAGQYNFIMPAEPVTISAVFEVSLVKGYVVLTIERFVLGLGYKYVPYLSPVYESDTVAKLLYRVLAEHGDTLTFSGSLDNGFYIASLSDPETKDTPIDPPSYLSQYAGLVRSTAAPGGVKATDPENLGEFHYTSTSGWMYSVNNWFPNVGASDVGVDYSGVYNITDGDVIRWQYTLGGYGADIGDGFDDGSGESVGSYAALENRTAYTYTLAQINSLYPKWRDANKETFENALAVVSDLDSTDSELQEAMAPLNEYMATQTNEFKVIIDRNFEADGYSFDCVKYAQAGDTVTFKVNEIPKGGEKGFYVNHTEMTPTDEAGVYTFVMPAENVVITAGTKTNLTKIELCDINANGTVDAEDVNTVINKFGESINEGNRGDTNLNGMVDAEDVNTVINAFGTEID